MRAVVALLLSLSLAGCFPNNARHRTYAKLAEGAMLAGGVALLYVANTAADCDMMNKPGMPPVDCRNNADLATTVGLGMVVVGLIGFIATVASAPDDPPSSSAPVPPTQGLPPPPPGR
jgi:hypothetical protein